MILQQFLSGHIIKIGENPRWRGVYLGPKWCFEGEYTYFRLIDCIYVHHNGNKIDQVCQEPSLPEEEI